MYLLGILLSSVCLVEVLAIRKICHSDYDVKQCVEGFLDRRSLRQCGGTGYALRCNRTGLREVPDRYPAPRPNFTPPPCLLDLNGNQLTELRNDSFIGTTCMNASDLLWLYFQHNRIHYIDSGAFNGLSNLIYLNLTDNSLTWPEGFGVGVFGPLISLENLNLKNNTFNNLDRLDKALMPMRMTLVGLYLNPTKQGLIFGEGFRKLTKLTVLSLSGMSRNVCDMYIVPNETFTNVPQIRHLFMNNCNISRIEADAFNPLKQLWSLDISYNEKLLFEGMNRALYGLRESQTLYELRVKRIHSLSECGIVFKEKNMKYLKTLRNLTLMHMDLNKIEVFDVNIFHPKFQFPETLRDFTLSGNRLTYGSYVHYLHNARNIYHLDISRQHLNYDPFFQHRSYPNDLPQNALHDYLSSWSTDDSSDTAGSGAPSSYSEDEISNPTDWLSSNGRSPRLAHISQRSNDNTYSYPINMLSNRVLLNYHSDSTITVGVKSDSIAPSDGLHGVDLCSCNGSNPFVICLPSNLTKIQWTKSYLFISIDKIRLCQAEKLRHLDLSYNLITKWIGPVYGLERLHHLALSNNFCGNVSNKFFSRFYGLIRLNISSNRIGSTFDHAPDYETNKLFEHILGLKFLDLSNNKINHLPELLFRNLTKLQSLLLTDNHLRDWKPVLSSKNLKFLDLAGNKLDDLPQFLLNYLDSQSQNHNVTLNLAYNKIECICDTVPFLKWTVETSVKIKFSAHDACKLGGHFTFLHSIDNRRAILHKLETDICSDRSWISMVVGCVSAVVGCLITLLVGVGVYKNRWKLRHLYYSRHRRFVHEGYEHLFAHDAYISYSKEKAGFIKNRLVPVLEGDHSLKLWVSDRDSRAGVSVAENIVHAIYNSRKTILLVDSDYLKDTWCDYDMNMALVESVETKRKLVVIVLMENFRMDALPIHMLRFLRSERSLEFPENGGDMETFWTNLASEINS